MECVCGVEGVGDAYDGMRFSTAWEEGKTKSAWHQIKVVLPTNSFSNRLRLMAELDESGTESFLIPPQ